MPLTALDTLLLATETANETMRAVGIAAAGMLLVFSTLILISAFLFILPRILKRLNTFWPEISDRHGSAADADAALDDEADVLAAIGYVLHVQARESR